mgnify:CR=1 FL=1
MHCPRTQQALLGALQVTWLHCWPECGVPPRLEHCIALMLKQLPNAQHAEPVPAQDTPVQLEPDFGVPPDWVHRVFDNIAQRPCTQHGTRWEVAQLTPVQL